MSNISNDSGLDDSAICGLASNAGAAASAATRLSWFLAEVDEGSMQNGKPNGKRRLCVLHSMELLESDVSDKYMTRFVEFRINGMKLEAKLILAADERKLVDAALVSMSREQRDEEDVRQLLVQYNEDDAAGNRLVQKIVSPQRAVWLSTKPELGGTPLIKLGPYLAHVLYAYEKREFMEKVLLHLKVRCFDQVFDEHLDASQQSMDDNTWLLVQYSPDPETVVYQVIPYSQTVWRHENLFKDVIAYVQLPGSDMVLQAVVICYGQDQQQLRAKYEQLRRFSLDLEFPQPEDLEEQLKQGTGTAALFARTSSTLFQRGEQRDASGEHKQLRRSLQQMSEKAQSEAEMIIDAFDMVDNINSNLKSRLGDAQVEVISSSSDELH